MSCSKKNPTYRCLCDALSGYYVYTEVSNRTGFYADAHLISPFFRQAGKTCKFKFWYHMWGPNIGYLQIYYRRNSRDKRMFSIFGNKGNKWIQGQVDVPKCANDFQVGKFFFLIGCQMALNFLLQRWPSPIVNQITHFILENAAKQNNSTFYWKEFICMVTPQDFIHRHKS